MTATTVLAWAAVTGVCAYSYALGHVSSADAIQGYETSWRFQLSMFAIFRLPLFLIGLVLAVWLQRRYWRSKPN